MVNVTCVNPYGIHCPPLPQIGVEIYGRVATRAHYLGECGLVKTHVYWDEIELYPGHYYWDTFDVEMASIKNWPIFMEIIGTPVFYRMSPVEALCSPPAKKYLSKFALFVLVLLRRYPQIQAIEIWNEPDVSAANAYAAGLDRFFGGFGINQAKYYGRMVRAVGMMARAAKLKVWVVAGGLLLDSPRSNFWKIARKKALGYYSAVSFHAYVPDQSANYDLIGRKIEWLRQDGEQLPLIVSETAYSAPSQESIGFRERQADYFDYVKNMSLIWKLATFIWFDLAENGWHSTSMIQSLVKYPVYYRYLEATRCSNSKVNDYGKR